MAPSAKDLVDVNGNQRDNIACKVKMELYCDSFRKETERLENTDDLVTDFDDSSLQKTIGDANLALNIASFICNTLADGIKELPEAMAGTAAAIRNRIQIVPPWVKIDNDAVLVRLWKAANVMDDLMAYAKETEKLARKTAEMASEAAARTEMTSADIAAAMKELQKAQKETIAAEKKKKEAEEKSQKESIEIEGKRASKKAQKEADDTNGIVNKAKEVVKKAQGLARQSSGQNPDVQSKMEEAQEALRVAIESAIETKKASDEAEKAQTKINQLVSSKSSSVEAVQKIEEEIQKYSEETDKHAVEAKSQAGIAEKSAKRVIDIVEEEKARDKAWKTAKEAKKVSESVKKDAEAARDAASDTKDLADSIVTDTEEASASEGELRKLSEETQATADEVIAAAEKAETLSETIEKMKTEDGEADQILEVLSETKDTIKEAKDAAEKARSLTAKCKEACEHGKVLVEKQNTVNESKKYSEEAKYLVDEVMQATSDSSEILVQANEFAAEERERESSTSKDGKALQGVTVTQTSNADEEVEIVDVDATLKEAKVVIEEAKDLQNEVIKAADATQDAAGEIEDKYQARVGLEDLLKHLERATRSMEQTRTVSAKAIDRAGQAGSSGKQVINQIDDKRTKQDANLALQQASKLAKSLNEEIAAANAISKEADDTVPKINTEMDDSDTVQQELSEAGQLAKTKADELQIKADRLEGKISILEAQFQEKEDKEKLKESIQSLKDEMAETQKVYDEAKDVIKTCGHKTKTRSDQVASSEKQEAAKSTNALIEEAKRVAREARDLVKDVKQSAKDTQHASDDCGRDTDEARRAIQIAEEAAQETKRAGFEVTRTAESIDRAIDDLTSVIKADRSTASDVKVSESKLSKCIENAEKAAEKAKSCMDRSTKAVEDMASKNPKGWKSVKYTSHDEDVLSVVRAPDGAFEGITIVCKENESLAKTVVGEHEELLSNVVSMEPQDVKLKKSALIGIRYIPPNTRIAGYEVVVKARDQNGDWKVIPTNSTERSYDEYRGLTFAEVKVDNFSTYVVVRRVVRDRHSVGKRGGAVTSSIDPRVAIAYAKDTLSSQTDVTLQVIPSDTTQLNVRRNKWESLRHLVSTSPVLHFSHARNVKIKKAMTITLPILLVSQEDEDHDRTTTTNTTSSSTQSGDLIIPGVGSFSSGGGDQKQKRRKEGAKNTGEVLLMGRDKKGSWRKVSGADVQYKKSGLIEAKVNEGVDRVLAIQMKEGSTTPPSQTAAAVEMSSLVKVANIILHHYVDDRARVIIQVVPSHRCDETVKELHKKGYEGPPSPSNEIEIREEQEFTVKFKQNIKLMDQEAYGEHEQKIIFREAFSNRMELFLEAADPFRNHSSDFDRGSAHFYKKDSETSKINIDSSVLEETWNHLTDLPVSLPKVEKEFRARQTKKDAVDAEVPLSNASLRDLAQEIGDEFEKLANYLEMPNSQLQRVKRDHPYNTEEQIFDLLISWRNKTKRSLNKVEILANALKKCGRTDLGEKILEMPK
ncbi:uncharacterized protein [Ptychodera flava]|uniref:uncharacterized protein n=1 Tax=Ptychodera flava TaxID=63121 RepID=UPI003969F456